MSLYFGDIGMRDIEISGTNRLRHGHGWLRCTIWSVFLLTGSLYTISYTFSSINKFFEYPIDVQLSRTHNDRLELPSITVCANDKYDMNSLQTLWNSTGHSGKVPVDADKILLSNYTLEEIWKEAGYKHQSLVKTCWVGPGRKCEDAGRWKEVFTRYGLCYTFSNAVAMMSGPHFGLYLKLTFQSGSPSGGFFRGYEIGIHDLESPADPFVMNGYHCSVKNESRGCFSLISIKAQVIQSLISIKAQRRYLLNCAKYPCTGTPGYNTFQCRANCISNFIANISGCRLPYMEVDYDTCRTREQVKSTEDLVIKFDIQGGFDYSNCECLQACSSGFYFWHSDTSLREAKEPIIKVFQDEPILEVLREEWAYGSNALIGDVGGIFGLMLGASILPIVQVIEVAIAKLLALVARANSPHFTQGIDNPGQINARRRVAWLN